MKTIAIAVALLLTGCVTRGLSQEAQSVFVTTDFRQVEGCESLGMVAANDRMNGGFLGQGAAQENAERGLRNLAAQRGATVVLLKSENTGFTGSKQQGEAFRCKR